MSHLTEAEWRLVHWQRGTLGSFYSALWKAISQADAFNLIKLRGAFPEDVDAFVNFSTKEDYWESIQERAGL